MNIHNSFSKSLTSLVIIGSLFGGMFLQPKKVDAFLGIGDIVTDFGNIFQSTTTAINSALNPLKEYGLDGLVTNITQRLLNKMVDNTLTWANGGFDGKPGYIQNWDDFLIGASYDVVNYGIGQAGSFANKKRHEKQAEVTAGLYSQCIDEAELNLSADATQEDENVAYSACEKYWSLEQKQSAYRNCLNKAEETIPADATPQEVASATSHCKKPLVNSGNTAEQNWNTHNSGGLDSSRNTVNVITQFGAKTINSGSGQRLDSLINGEGETMVSLLGSQSRVNDFKNGDMRAGGWFGYAAYGDPHNNEVGRASLITGALNRKIQKKKAEKQRDVDTPQTFLSKTECEEYKLDAEGYETTECKREIINTPGPVVKSKVDYAVNKEERQTENAKELTDVMAQALGRLGKGLITVGLRNISTKIKGKGASQKAQNDPRYKDVYQNDYDVLGIGSGNTKRDDVIPIGNGIGASKNNTRGFDLNNASLSRDASIPNIEDLERIMNMQTDFERAIINTRKQILNKAENIEVLKAARAGVRDLDRCVPGPDYNWEERFQGLIDTAGSGYGGKFEDASEDNDEDEGKVKKIEKKEEKIRENLKLIDSYKKQVIVFQKEIDNFIILIDGHPLRHPLLVIKKEEKIKFRNKTNKEIIKLQTEVAGLQTDIRILLKQVEKQDNYTSPKVNAQANKLAYNNMRAMVNDPRLNIPGALDMKTLINSYIKSGNIKIARAQEEIDTVKSAQASLKKLYDLILPKYEFYRALIAKKRKSGLIGFLKLPLIGSSWEKLSDAEKLAIMNLKSEGVIVDSQQNISRDLFASNDNVRIFKNNSEIGTEPLSYSQYDQITAPPSNIQLFENNNSSDIPSYLLEVEGSEGSAMILNEINGLTPEEFLANNPEKSKQLVLGYAWKILKESFLATPAIPAKEILSGEEQYNNILRYFFVMRDNIPTEKDLLKAAVALDSAKENNNRLDDYVSDCQTLRKFVTGFEGYPNLKNEGVKGGGEILELSYSEGDKWRSNSKKRNYDAKNGSVKMLHVNTLTDEFKYDFIFEPGSSRNKSPKREEINDFLIEERAKQKNNQPSLFKTDIVTSKASRKKSILDFNASDMKYYYRDNYGSKAERSLEDNPIPFGNLVAYDIQKVYERDYIEVSFISNNRKVFGQTGLLFCWSEGDYSLNKKGKVKNQDRVISECLKTWYYAKDIDYKILFSGII